MAGPGGREVGRISIRVLPDTSKFGTELNAYLERIESRLELEIPVSLDARSVAQTEAELEFLTRDREIDIEMDTRALTRNVGGVTGFLARWGPLIAAATIAIGGLVAALPAAVGLVAAPLAAIILGFDGIKAAAAGLSDEVEHLRESLSATFEQLLTPGFERLADLFPTLEDGLGRIALAVSQVFDAFSRAVTTQESMALIDSILTNIADTVSRFAELGGVDFLTDSLLLLADAGTQATASLTPEFVELFRQFNDELERMSENGDLQKGMEGIGHAFYFLATAIGFFVLNAIRFFATLERIGEAIFTFATETIPNAFDDLTTAIDTAWTEIVDRTQEVPDQMIGSFTALPGELERIGADAIQGLWDGMTSKIEPLLEWLNEKAQQALDTFGFLWELDSPSKAFRRLGQFAGEGLQLGFEDSMPDVIASASLMATGSLKAASAGSLLPTTLPVQESTRPIRMADGTLFGWVRQIANGEAELVLNNANFASTFGASA